MSESPSLNVALSRLDRWWLPAVIGVIAVLLWLWLATGPRFLAPIIAIDIEQGRTSSAAPIPRSDFTLQQTFTARWDGMREIELILVRHDGDVDNGRFKLQLQDVTSGRIIAEDNVDTRFLNHNDVYTFRFPPQRRSAGQDYALLVSGTQRNPITLWGYGLDVYGNGDLTFLLNEPDVTPPISEAQELTFTTRYQLTWFDALAALGTMLWQNGRLFLLALTFIPLPGLLILLLGPKAWWQWELMAKLGVAYALGVAVWPLLWLGVTLLNGRFSPFLLWLLFIVGWLLIPPLWYRRRTPPVATPEFPPPSQPRDYTSLILLALLLLAFAVRLLAVRDLAFPPWVDASRHGLITAVMAHNGQVISDYAPYLDIDRFPYHYGFHTLSASLHLMLGTPLPALLLFLGQLLNALIPLTIYAAGWLMSSRQDASRRKVGLFAAFLVALPFFFPAYYVTWGRLTQLTAVLLLPVLLAFTWQLINGDEEKSWRKVWWLVALLAAGLFLLHFRVFIYYVPFAAIAWLAGKGKNGRWLALATGCALLLISPRLIQLILTSEPAQTAQSTIRGYNDFPVSYVTTGWERQFLILAAIALIIAVNATFFKQRWATAPNMLVLWIGCWLLLLSPQLNLLSTSIINLNSLYIIVFVPLALMLALVLLPVWHWFNQHHWSLRFITRLLLTVLLAITTLFGIQRQITILNTQTILARPADNAGLAWVDAHLPPSAKIAVSSWLWLGNTWAVADGGAWMVSLTQRQATTPPADYIYSHKLLAEVNGFNETATAVSDWSDPAHINWLAQQGVTHIYVGAKGGYFDPLALSRNPQLTMYYAADGVFIFALP